MVVDKNLGDSPLVRAACRDRSQSYRTWHLPIIRRILIYRLQLTSILLLHREQSIVEKMHKTQHPVKSSFHHEGKNSSLFLFDRLAIAQCFGVRHRQLYSPIGLRGPRLYFLLRRLHHAKFLKDITEITTQPKLTFLPYCWPYGGMGLSLWDRWTDGQHTWAGGAGGYLLDHRMIPCWTQK